MHPADWLFAGIDPSSTSAEVIFCILDAQLKIVALDEGSIDASMDALAGRAGAAVAINSPAGAP